MQIEDCFVRVKRMINGDPKFAAIGGGWTCQFLFADYAETEPEPEEGIEVMTWAEAKADVDRRHAFLDQLTGRGKRPVVVGRYSFSDSNPDAVENAKDVDRLEIMKDRLEKSMMPRHPVSNIGE